MSELVIVEKELSYLIMQAAYEVHNELGPGFPESIYEEAMNRELTRRGIRLERQKESLSVSKESLLVNSFWIMLPMGELFLSIKQSVRSHVYTNNRHYPI